MHSQVRFVNFSVLINLAGCNHNHNAVIGIFPFHVMLQSLKKAVIRLLVDVKSSLLLALVQTCGFVQAVMSWYERQNRRVSENLAAFLASFCQK